MEPNLERARRDAESSRGFARIPALEVDEERGLPLRRRQRLDRLPHAGEEQPAFNDRFDAGRRRGLRLVERLHARRSRPAAMVHPAVVQDDAAKPPLETLRGKQRINVEIRGKGCLLEDILHVIRVVHRSRRDTDGSRPVTREQQAKCPGVSTPRAGGENGVSFPVSLFAYDLNRHVSTLYILVARKDTRVTFVILAW